MTVVSLSDVSKDGELVTVAPDDTKAIVMHYSKGQVNLAVYDFATKQKRPLTEFWYTFFAVWSPDARRVSYHTSPTFDASELRVTTLDGRSTAVYRNDGAQSVQPVGWTPDGATIVAVVRRPDKTWTVGTLPATGGAFTPLRSLGWSYDWRDGAPRLSPDGRFVAYVNGEKGLRDVHVVGVDGRDEFRITDDPADDTAPIWSPDSRHLAFTSNRQGAVSLWIVDVQAGKPVGRATKLKDGIQSARLVDWTQRGIFYEQQATLWDLYTAPMDSVQMRPTGPPSQIPYSRTGRNVGPVWSPDGARLAFVSSSAAEPNRRYVVVMSPNGAQVREFLIPTTAFQYPQSPNDLRWFGDGRGLGFSGTDARGATAAFRLMLETGEWETVPIPVEGIGARIEWNRDGSAIYFKRTDLDNPGIFERAFNGDTERPVYRSVAPVLNIGSLEFSPDRKWLAFQQFTPDADGGTMTKRIAIVDVATGETRTVLEVVRKATDSNDAGVPDLMGWSPAGELLIERRGTGNATAETLLVPVNGGAPRSVAFPGFASSRGETQPAAFAKVSPDGRSIVLGRRTSGWETFVIENPLAPARAATASR
jgi:Tol biopolymer transport system component